MHNYKLKSVRQMETFSVMYRNISFHSISFGFYEHYKIFIFDKLEGWEFILNYININYIYYT